MAQTSGAAMYADHHIIDMQAESLGDSRVENLCDPLHFQIMISSAFPTYIFVVNLY